ncbi:glycine cleavage system protein H [Clostridium sp. W14A]|uniref:Glycine cleavage system H protein n=1 Tax=Caproicibacter fermentans TaxID=2576756 RepID=A0A7G8TEA6_9FIRM|nr:glycine cleavage system protein GcvH [Caproicibacter fermentans]OCN00105.1 glycine cleavage system protein H [Clostridium sp. W14A]QNK41947.1 glycine cleavage system protein GcvH [Caproicibacter fermentans]
MNLPEELKYTKSHEWVSYLPDGSAKIGLTDFAQKELGDIVFVNLPQEGDSVEAGAAFADVESVKAVSDVYCPVTGTVQAINEELLDAPEQLNKAPYESWMVRVGDISKTEELLSAGEYLTFLSGKEGD